MFVVSNGPSATQADYPAGLSFHIFALVNFQVCSHFSGEQLKAPRHWDKEIKDSTRKPQPGFFRKPWSVFSLATRELKHSANMGRLHSISEQALELEGNLSWFPGTGPVGEQAILGVGSSALVLCSVKGSPQLYPS